MMENPDDQFSLKWNNFQTNLASGFHDLLQEEDMVDVTLAAEGKYLQAHKVILSVCSPYFRDLFKANPCKHPIVILKDVGHQELADMLDFMYRGEASVRQEDLAAFLKLAETLKVKGLAGDKTADPSATSTQQQPVSPRKPNVVKKKRIVEASVFEPDDDPGEAEFVQASEEPKRKRKRLPSPQPKTDASSTSAAVTSSYVPLVEPKQELPESEEVEFLDDGASDALADYIEKGKGDVTSNDFEDSNLDLATGDDTANEMDMTAAGSSMLDESSDQVPQERLVTSEQFDPTRLLKTELPELPEPLVELIVPKEEVFLPPGTTISPSTTITRIRADSRPMQRDLFFPTPPGTQQFSMSQSSQKFYPQAYMQRHRGAYMDLRPPHDSSNPIWEYFTLEEDRATCKVCGKRITYRNNAYVTNLVTHLRTRGVGHDRCYNYYMLKKGETSSKVRDEMALTYLLSNMASTVFGQPQMAESFFGAPHNHNAPHNDTHHE